MRPGRLRLAVAVAAAVAALGALSAPALGAASYLAQSPSPCGTAPAGQTPQINHVVWVVFENKPTSTVYGNPSADPYLGGLGLACGRASDYESAPSFPAKLAMTSGSDWGLTTDAQVVPGPDLFSQLGTDWTAYMGSMPSNCYSRNVPNKTYYVRHNPAYYYTDNRAACATRDLPLPATPADLDLSRSFTWVEANVPQSMHACKKICGKTAGAQLAMGDSWAQTWVAGILQSPQYLAGDTAVFIVWDQGSGKSDRTTLMVVSPYTTPGYVTTASYNHYSLLRGTEDLLGLPALGQAADPATTSLAGDFGLSS